MNNAENSNNVLRNLNKNKVNQMNLKTLLFSAIDNLLKQEPTNNANIMEKFKKNIQLLFGRLIQFISIDNRIKRTNSNNELNSDTIIIQFKINKDDIELNSDLVFELNWGPEKRFNEYLNVLIDEIGMGTFNNFRNKGSIKLSKLLDKIKSNNSNVNVQSDFAIQNIKNLINKINSKNKINFNNSNIAKEISQLNTLINSINENKKSGKLLNSNKIKLIIELKEKLETSKGKNNNEDLTELLSFIDILINSNNLSKLDYLYAFLFNAYIGKYVNPFERKSLLIDTEEYLKKQYLFMKTLNEQYNTIKNKNNKTLMINLQIPEEESELEES